MMIAAAQSSLYLFLDVVSSDTYHTISGVQLGRCLACLFASIEETLKLANWSNEKTFAKYYYRSVASGTQLGEMIPT